MDNITVAINKIENGYPVTSTKYLDNGLDCAYTPPVVKTIYAGDVNELGSVVTTLLGGSLNERAHRTPHPSRRLDGRLGDVRRGHREAQGRHR